MQIDWLTGSRQATCVLCGDGGAKSEVLIVDHVLASLPRVRLLRCPACGCAFLHEPPPYSYAAVVRDGVADHYVEQGAGIDVMVMPLLRVPAASVRRLLEIGCGYGFALDFGREVFGWHVQGVDPSPLGAIGGRALQISIVNEYLDRNLDLGREPFDLVLCSEVLEHVARPHGLLEAIVARLADDGILVLTTPNLDVVRPATAADTLGRVLSAGLHVVLYDRAALGRVLTEAGLPAFRIEESEDTLVAFAARSAASLERLCTASRAGRSDIRHYFAERARSFPADSVLASGLAYRHFKECVNGALYDEATASRDLLDRVCRARFGIDLEEPAAAVEGLRRALSPDAAGPVPYNLGGALYFTGMLELNHRRSPARAVEYLAAAAEATRLLLEYERPLSIYDYETLDLSQQSRKHLPVALAAVDPDRAVRACEALAQPSADPTDTLPAAIGDASRALTFTRLVNGGALAAAERLAPAVASAAAAVDASRAADSVLLDALFCLGILALQRGRTGDAAEHFRLAFERSRGAAPERAQFLWSARLHEGIALARSGNTADADRGDRILRSIADGVDTSLPPVPTDIVSRALSTTRTQTGGRR